MDADLIQLFALMVGPTGAAWVGVKGSMNGMKARQVTQGATLDKQDKTLDKIVETQAEHGERLMRLEIKHEADIT